MTGHESVSRGSNHLPLEQFRLCLSHAQAMLSLLDVGKWAMKAGIMFIGGACLIGAGVALAITNPSQADYNDFAVANLSVYLKTEVCTLKLPIVGTALRQECEKLVDTNQSQLKVIIAANTTRKDYLFFSLYRTELSPRQILPFLPEDLLPSYEAEAIGIFNTFQLYRAREQPRSQQGFWNGEFDWRISAAPNILPLSRPTL